ncbi:MAG TPA: SHOCT domain-containing protein [Limnochordales bacterium]
MWSRWPGPMVWYGPWWLGPLMAVLFWALLIGGAAWLVRFLVVESRARHPEQPDRAIAILEERFARGEITAEEFRQMRSELEASRRARL